MGTNWPLFAVDAPGVEWGVDTGGDAMDMMQRWTLTIDFVEPLIQQDEALETLDDIIRQASAQIRQAIEQDAILQEQLALHNISLIMALSR